MPGPAGRPEGAGRSLFFAWGAGALLKAVLRAAARPLLLVAAGPALAAAAPLHGPYKDVTRDLAAPEPRIVTPAWHDPQRAVLLWAFATGACGDERWGEGIDTEAFARANVAQARALGQRYIVSTGGALGLFSCASDDGMARFVERYDSPLLLALDFDIEGAQTPAQIDELVDRLAVLQQRRPHLRLMFTLATHASADGRGLNDTGRQVMAAIARSGLRDAVINLMVMNYGAADRRWCLPRAGRCDMGRSALQAVRNLQRGFGVPPARIAVTAMPGENDVAGNVFTTADAQRLARAARRLGLFGVFHWSVDRDQPCPPGEPRVSPRCHALPAVPAGRFGRLLQP